VVKIIKCLSIRPPYADWIVNPQRFIDADIKPKTIENREWSTQYRGPLLIHSSGKFEADAIDYWMYRHCPQMRGVWSEDKKDYHLGMIVGIADLVDCVTEHESPWFVGSYGFVLANARPFRQPISHRGQLGLFNVPMSVVEHEIGG
jgi:hypothetical protein